MNPVVALVFGAVIAVAAQAEDTSLSTAAAAEQRAAAPATAPLAPTPLTGTPGPSEPSEAPRHVTLAVGLGFHSLVPLGLLVGINFTPQLTLDVGFGYSLVRGARTGVRARYQLFRGPVAPFVGLGTYVNPSTRRSSGVGFAAPGGGRESTTLHAGWFIDPVVGVVLHGTAGFFGLLGGGYAIRVAGSSDDHRGLPSVEVLGGYSF